MLTVENAVEKVLNATRTASVETIALPQALYRVLGQTVAATHDSPPFDKALMDGFALNSLSFQQVADTDPDATIHLKVHETLTAGQLSSVDLCQGGTVRVMTGVAVPKGTDCVIPIEFTQFSEASSTTVGIPVARVAAGYSVMRRGESARAGEQLLAPGLRLNAQHLAAMAEFGIADVVVHRTPRCAVLATGDELVPFHQTPAAGQIRNSNEPMLIGQIRQSFGEPSGLGIATDDRETLRVRIEEGLKCDFLLLTGGVSAGILDLVPAVLQECGVQRVFHGVKMKPGKPIWFGVCERDGHRCYVFGLPGNPVSSLACFELFVKPAIRKFSGLNQPAPMPLRAELLESFQTRGDRPVYHPARIEWSSSGLVVRTVRWTGSADLRATVDANGMALFEPQSDPVPAGSLVPVWFWADNCLTANGF